MSQDERIQRILEYMKINLKITLEDICSLYGVSYDTARRDLVKMEQNNQIVRIRGGAMLPTFANNVPSYRERHSNLESKRLIAMKAASLINDGDYLLFDTSTTVQYVAEFLNTKNNVAVTNSIDIASTLSNKENIAIHLLGGEFHTWHRYTFGPRTLEMLSHLKVNKLFLGACALNAEGVFSTTVEDAYMKMEMIRRANQVILLADSSKFGKDLFYRVCPFDKIDIIITDSVPSPDMNKTLDDAGVNLIIAKT
ncbi:DeoR/GlpR family DNA-binding transcription regulator [Paenibacillus alkalitolerans]|uniref:DeoR/GlpR family DNA-binding transcription regulator n=1 Tax=Paenibacillus alkalitolerans TaxID=2799335 RepID=UPI0018F4768A|nr:DeoR/GlpR family DNA-binding transcription regulator [Paenibacillus alkalitolerans]